MSEGEKLKWDQTLTGGTQVTQNTSDGHFFAFARAGAAKHETHILIFRCRLRLVETFKHIRHAVPINLPAERGHLTM